MPVRDSTLRAYVPEIVARWLHESPDDRALTTEGSLLFADLSGFTALSERLARLGREGAEQLTDVVDGVFSELITVADQSSGQLLSFGGDALLVLFTGDQHARRAARTAHTLRARVRQLGRRDTGVGKVRLRVSIGVHSGRFDLVLAGDVQRTFLLAGADVTTTVAAEHAAQAGEICVTAECAAHLPGGTWRQTPRGLLLTRAPTAPDLPRQRGSQEVDVSRAIPVALHEHLHSGLDLLQHRMAAVAFLHAGSLDGALAHDPAGAVRALNQLSERVHDICSQHQLCCLGADVDVDGVKFIIVSGVPTTSGDNEERLLLGILEVMSEPWRLPLQAGIHRGTVFAGAVGPPFRRTYTVMGDTVNVAARLMAHAQPGETLASTDLLDHCRSTYVTGPTIAHAAKGKSLPVHAAAVLGRAPDSPISPTESIAMVGRASELDVLTDAWHRAVGASTTEMAEVSGDPGIGKSTLLAALSNHVGDVRRLRLRGDLFTRTTPYRGLRSLLQMVADLPDPGPDLDPALLALSPDLAARWGDRLPLLNDVVQSTLPDTDHTRSLSGQARRRTTFELALHIVEQMCPGPALFILEDTHWFDDATSEWLTTVAAAHPRRPWLMVSTRRPIDGGFTLPPDAGTHLTLTPLGDQAAAELIRAERGDRPVPPHLVRTIASRAGGNPLFLRELVRALGTDDDVQALPDSLDELLMTRLDRLSSAERHLVCRASVLGQRFPRELLSVVMDAESVSPHVLTRVSDFVAPAPGGRLGFTHALIRDAAYQLLPYRKRRELHSHVARHLADADADLGVLSFHYFAAQEWEQAWRTSRGAADAALASHAPVEASELLERALAASRHVAALTTDEQLAVGLELSRSYERSGRFDTAERTYRRLAPLATTPLARARVKIQLAWLAERQSKLPVAVRRARAASTLLAGVPVTEREAALAEARTVEGMALEVAGDHVGAARALTEAVQLARRRGQPHTEAQAASILDWSLAMSGQLDEPVHLLRALDLYRDLGDVAGEASCLTNLGALAYFDGHWSDAVEFYRKGQSAHTRAGDETSAALGAANTGEVLSDQGHWGAAATVLIDALDVWRSTGHEHGVAYAEGLLGRTRARAHEFDQAFELLNQAHGRHLAVGAKGDAALVSLWLAEAHCLRGAADEALEHLDGGADDGSTTAARIRATAIGLSDRSLGLDELVRVRARADEEREQFEVVVIDHTRAAFDPDHAEAHLAGSADVAGQLGVVQIACPGSLSGSQRSSGR